MRPCPRPLAHTARRPLTAVPGRGGQSRWRPLSLPHNGSSGREGLVRSPSPRQNQNRVRRVVRGLSQDSGERGEVGGAGLLPAAGKPPAAYQAAPHRILSICLRGRKTRVTQKSTHNVHSSSISTTPTGNNPVSFHRRVLDRLRHTSVPWSAFSHRTREGLIRAVTCRDRGNSC